MEMLGLAYPIADHDAMWSQIRRKVIDALTSIREELEELAAREPDPG